MLTVHRECRALSSSSGPSRVCLSTHERRFSNHISVVETHLVLLHARREMPKRRKLRFHWRMARHNARNECAAGPGLAVLVASREGRRSGLADRLGPSLLRSRTKLILYLASSANGPVFFLQFGSRIWGRAEQKAYACLFWSSALLLASPRSMGQCVGWHGWSGGHKVAGVDARPTAVLTERCALSCCCVDGCCAGSGVGRVGWEGGTLWLVRYGPASALLRSVGGGGD